jgi:hypothetical protein
MLLFFYKAGLKTLVVCLSGLETLLPLLATFELPTE